MIKCHTWHLFQGGTILKTPRLVCFDLDDTLIYEKHSVMIPCIMNKKELEHDIIQKSEEAGEIDYQAADYLRACLLKGLKESKIKEDFLKIAKPIKNIKETVSLLQQQGAKCIIITVGPIQVAKVVCELFGFDDCYGSDYDVVDGEFTGKINSYVSAEEKINCLIDYCTKTDIQPIDCMSIGDGTTDVPLFKYCSRSIAINSSESVKNEATHWVDTDDLLEILQFIFR